MISRLMLISAFVPAAIGYAGDAIAVDDVNLGTLFTLTNTTTAPNGAWSWFEDERAIIDTQFAGGPLLLVSSVSDGGGGEEGDIDLLWRNLTTGVQGEFEFNNTLEADDHDSAALHILPDGRYLASYSRHNTDQLTRWRVSTNPHDPTAWGQEKTLDNADGTTYNNTYYLPGDNGGDGVLYNFTRARNYDPNVQTWDSANQAWVYRGKLLTQGNGGDRPYLRYATDGDKIHFIATEEHPRNFANSIYHGYVKDGQLFDTDGNLIDANIFNASGVSPTSLTQLFANGSQSNGVTMNRAWTISMEIDAAGKPVAVFSVRANDQEDDHRFFYARHDGTDWVVNEMAKAGGFLYAPENDYTGLVSIDPNNADVVYMSSEIDPITGQATTSGKYELYQGVTSDFGTSWTWSAITENSTVDNLRPLVPAWDEQNTAVVWMRGNYNTYRDWDTQVVGISFENAGFKAWSGANSNVWDGAAQNWISGGATTAYDVGDHVTFSDNAAALTVDIQDGALLPASVTFTNDTNAYTLTGSGIAGTGELRVVGGGTVTLNNQANTYTGDTTVTHGKLVLQNAATLSGSARIEVAADGHLDVAGINAGVYTLNGQTLVIDGQVTGDLNVRSGSSVHVNNTVNGNLTVNASAVQGLGSVNGDLTAQSDTLIQVGDAGFEPQFTLALTTYLDAGLSNTTLANGVALTPGTDYLDLTGGGSVNSADNAWDYRAFGNGPGTGTVFSSNNNGNEDAPTLAVTIDGLTPGEEVEVFAYTWGSGTASWRVRASLLGPDADGSTDGQVDQGWNTDHTASSSFSSTDAVTRHITGGLNGGPLSTDDGANTSTTNTTASFEIGGYFGNGTGVIETAEGNRSLYQASLGFAIADANGEVTVYIDDLANAGSSNRTFFDGVGYRPNLPSNVMPQVNTLAVTGDVSLQAGSTLALDVFGPTTLDRLVVAGVFTAGGTLDVDLVPGAPLPQLGDSFDLIDFGSAAGTFSSLDLPELEPGLYWDTSTLLTSGVLSVTDTAPALPGDTDGDGDIDDSDLGTSFSNYTGPLAFGTGGKTAAQGDTDGDGDVDDSDLGTSFSGYTGPISINVPEPSTCLLLVTTAVLAARRRGSSQRT